MGGVQPIDAAASVIDGTLLGAAETAYVGTAMVVNSLCTLAIMVTVTQGFSRSLAAVWCTIKLMSLGRIITGYLRFRSGKGLIKLGLHRPPDRPEAGMAAREAAAAAAQAA